MANEQPATQALGRYELVQLLGQGGMGEVYLAKITGAAGFEKPCIVKTILPALMNDGSFLDRFHHEAKVLVHLVHSNIAQVYDMGEAGGTYFMALEYVAGVDLSHLEDQVRRHGTPVPLPIALFIAARIAEGLGYAHRKVGPDGVALGIVHRDVSPQNVMLSYEGEVKVIDFGLAKSAARSKHTLPSTVMGKLGYMSPEQARAESLDHRSDIYSCGVVIWELLAGQPLVPHGTMGEMMAFMASPKVPSLSAMRPDVDPALEAIIQRALAPSPADRHQRADDLARLLTEHLVRTGASVSAEEVGNYVRALCPEAYAAQRQLISKLTSVNRGKTPLPLTSSMRMPSPQPVSAQAGFEPTTVRSPLPPPVSSQAGFAPTSVRQRQPPLGNSLERDLVAAGVGRRPRRWLIPLGAALLVGATAAGTAWWVRRPSPQPAPETPAPTPDTKATAEAKGTEATAEAKGTEATAEAKGTEATAEAKGAEATAAAKGAEATADEGERRVKRDPGKKQASEAALVPAGRVADLFADRGAHYARAGGAVGLSVGDEVAVVGPPQGGQRRVLGGATVLEVWPKLARLRLDARAKSSSGKRFVALPDAPASAVAVAPQAQATNPAPEAPSPAAPTATAETKPPPGVPAAEEKKPEPPPAEPAAKAPHVLMGRATLGGAWPLKNVTIFNSDTLTWNLCKVIIQGKKTYHLGSLAPGGKRTISLGDFELDSGQRFVGRNLVGLTCAEGQGDFPARF